MGREFELKYKAVPQQLDRIAAEFSDLSVIEMASLYYDTPDCALSQRRITLRRRLENGVSVCTVKTPGSHGGRGEWEVQCQRIEDAISVLCKLGAPEELRSLCGSGLITVCSAQFTRRAKTIRLDGGAVELALDQGVLHGGGRQIPLCEVEIELKEGPDALAASFAGALAERFGLLPETKSKFHRALALVEE